MNSETLRKAAPRIWARLGEHDDEFATDLAQAILVSHLDMIKAVLDHLGVPHEDGFFAKDAEVAQYLKEGWQQEVWEKFHATFSARGAAILYQSPRLGNRQGGGRVFSRPPNAATR